MTKEQVKEILLEKAPDLDFDALSIPHQCAIKYYLLGFNPVPISTESKIPSTLPHGEGAYQVELVLQENPKTKAPYTWDELLAKQDKEGRDYQKELDKGRLVEKEGAYYRWKYQTWKALQRERIKEGAIIGPLSKGFKLDWYKGPLKPWDNVDVGIVCGPVSRNKEAIDIDTKNDSAGTILDDFEIAVKEKFGEAFYNSLYITRTGSGGGHVPYLLEEPEDCNLETGLAHRYWGPEKNGDIRAVIETKGVTKDGAGFIKTVGSQGYSVVQGSIDTIPTLDIATRDQLWDLCRELGTVEKKIKKKVLDYQAKRTVENKNLDRTKPMTDFNESDSSMEFLFTLLEKENIMYYAGEEVGASGESIPLLRRSGNPSSKHSAKWFSNINRLYTWSDAISGVTSAGVQYSFEAQKIYSPSDIYKLIKGCTNSQAASDFKAMGYGQPADSNTGGEEQAAALAPVIWKEQGVDYGAFDVLEFNFTKTNRLRSVTVRIDKYIEFLKEHGFRKYFYNNDYSRDTQLIHVVNNVVKPASQDYARDYILGEYEKAWGDSGEDLKKLVAAKFHSRTALFKLDFLKYAPTIDLQIVRGGPGYDWFFFKNGAVKNTADGATLLPYKDLPGLVWESQIKDRLFKVLNPEDFVSFDFKKFITNVSGNKPLPLEVTIGYALHTYNDPSNRRAVFLTDSNTNEAAMGRTGKSLIVDFTGQLRDSAKVDGKAFNSRDQFMWSEITQSTEVIWIDDIKQRFDFEFLFNVISNMLRVNKKHQDPFTIGFDKLPNIVITTNHGVIGTGDSFNARTHFYELTKYYSDTYQPIDDFGKLFWGPEWSESDWLRNDNYALWCQRQFFQHGLIKQESSMRHYKALVSMSCLEFADYAGETFKDLDAVDPKPISEFTLAFKQEMSDNEISFSKRLEERIDNTREMRKWLGAFAESKGYTFEESGRSFGSRKYNYAFKKK